MIDNLQKACYTRPSFLQETTKQDDPDFCKEKEKLIPFTLQEQIEGKSFWSFAKYIILDFAKTNLGR